MNMMDRLRAKLLPFREIAAPRLGGYGINVSFEDFWSRAIVLANVANRTRPAAGETVVFADMKGTVPAGLYTVFGGGKLVPAREVGPGLFEVEPGLSGLRLRGMATSIRLPNSSGEFYLPFLELMRTLRPAVVRTLDWTRANERGTTKPTVSAGDQARLCRELGCDLHLVVPHFWTPSEVRAALAEIALVLPGKRVIIEFSNEIWNPGFPQYRDLRPGGGRPFETVAARLRLLWLDADEILPGNKRFVGGWIAQPEFLEQMLEAVDDRVDLAGPATYIGPSPQDIEELRDETVITEDMIYSLCLRRIVQTEPKLKANVEVARRFGAIPYLYECGLDLKPGNEAWRPTALRMQGSEALGDVVRRTRLMHELAGVRRGCWYSLMTSWTPGVPQYPFGFLESMDQNPREVPKCREAFRL